MLLKCEFCGRLYSLTRSDKKACSNQCAVKIIYYRKHNFLTPLEQYTNQHLTITNKIEFTPNHSEEDSNNALLSATKRLEEFKLNKNT